MFYHIFGWQKYSPFPGKGKEKEGKRLDKGKRGKGKISKRLLADDVIGTTTS